MQIGAFFKAMIHSANQCFVLEEVAVLNGLGDTGQLLVYHAAGADVGMSHLGIAHLSVRKAHIKAGCADLGVWILSEQLV